MLQGILSPSSCPSCCSSGATGGRTARCSGRSRDWTGWHSIGDYPDAREVPGVVVYRWEAPLFFANAGAFRDQVRRLVREREPAWFVLQCEAITDIDVTAADMLEQLDHELNAEGIHLAFVEMRNRCSGSGRAYGLLDTLDRRPLLPDDRSGRHGDRPARDLIGPRMAAAGSRRYRLMARWHRFARAVSWTPPTSTEIGAVAKSALAAGLAWLAGGAATGVTTRCSPR